ncbi:MAG: hypothetical protein LBB14_02700 [Puniceicoccales bacterium]|nr:hypothetical protein [Puniceicoccales bacterium]
MTASRWKLAVRHAGWVSALLAIAAFAFPPFALVGAILSAAIGLTLLFHCLYGENLLRRSRIFSGAPDNCVALAVHLMEQVIAGNREQTEAVTALWALLKDSQDASAQEFLGNRELVELFVALLKEQNGDALAIFEAFPPEVRQLIAKNYGIAVGGSARLAAPTAAQQRRDFSKLNCVRRCRITKRCETTVNGFRLLAIALDLAGGVFPPITFVAIILSGTLSFISLLLSLVASYNYSQSHIFNGSAAPCKKLEIKLLQISHRRQTSEGSSSQMALLRLLAKPRCLTGEIFLANEEAVQFFMSLVRKGDGDALAIFRRLPNDVRGSACEVAGCREEDIPKIATPKEEEIVGEPTRPEVSQISSLEYLDCETNGVTLALNGSMEFAKILAKIVGDVDSPATFICVILALGLELFTLAIDAIAEFFKNRIHIFANSRDACVKLQMAIVQNIANGEKMTDEKGTRGDAPLKRLYTYLETPETRAETFLSDGGAVEAFRDFLRRKNSGAWAILRSFPESVQRLILDGGVPIPESAIAFQPVAVPP